MQQWPYSGSDAQRWRIDARPNGGYTFTAKHSGLLLQVAGGGQANGVAVQQGTAQACATTAAARVVGVTGSILSSVPGATPGPVAALAPDRLSAYPNPANDFVTVLLPDGTRPIDLVVMYDALGRLRPMRPSTQLAASPLLSYRPVRILSPWASLHSNCASAYW